MARVVVGCAHGNESPDSVVVAYLTAGAALDRGDEVLLWLTSDGVRLATNGYVADIRQDMEPPVQRVHDQFIEKGGSTSSMSGKPYLVQCGDAKAVTSGAWLTVELQALRKSGRLEAEQKALEEEHEREEKEEREGREHRD